MQRLPHVVGGGHCKERTIARGSAVFGDPAVCQEEGAREDKAAGVSERKLVTPMSLKGATLETGPLPWVVVPRIL